MQKLTADKIKFILLTIALLLLVVATGRSQFIITAGAGATNKYFSAELQVGWRFNNTTLTAGYIALPHNTQPVLFNVRAGQIIANKVHVYGGYVRQMYSSDDKTRNSNTWQAGAQYLFYMYEKSGFYAGGTYNGNRTVSAHVGMTYNIF